MLGGRADWYLGSLAFPGFSFKKETVFLLQTLLPSTFLQPLCEAVLTPWDTTDTSLTLNLPNRPFPPLAALPPGLSESADLISGVYVCGLATAE